MPFQGLGLSSSNAAGGTVSATNQAVTSATTTGLKHGIRLDLFGIPGTVAGRGHGWRATWGAIGPFLVKAILVVAGLWIIALAAFKATSPAIKRGAEAAEERRRSPRRRHGPASSSPRRLRRRR